MSYADVNGISLYYEEHGSGQPLVLLHGGLAAGSMYAPILPELAKGRRVILVDLQAHGHTADVDRPLRYETMADDIAGLIGHLGLERADVMGYSFGAATAVRTAIQHPALVRRLVIVSVPFRRDGWYPESLAGMDQMGSQLAEMLKQGPLYDIYAGGRAPGGGLAGAAGQDRRTAAAGLRLVRGPREDHRAGDAGLRGRRRGAPGAHRGLLRPARRRPARRELGRLGPVGGPAGRPAGPDALRSGRSGPAGLRPAGAERPGCASHRPGPSLPGRPRVGSGAGPAGRQPEHGQQDRHERARGRRRGGHDLADGAGAAARRAGPRAGPALAAGPGG